MKRFGKLVLILAILMIGIFLTGCYCCPTCSPVNQRCTLTVTAGYWVWGEVSVNGQLTGQNIDFSIPSIKTVTIDVPCNQEICIIIVDPCGVQSHSEWVYINPGQNYLSFLYW